jgi:hypothetical protein
MSNVSRRQEADRVGSSNNCDCETSILPLSDQHQKRILEIVRLCFSSVKVTRFN